MELCSSKIYIPSLINVLRKNTSNKKKKEKIHLKVYIFKIVISL